MVNHVAINRPVLDGRDTAAGVHGVRAMLGSVMQYSPRIEPSDEVVIDFDVKSFIGAGLYALEMIGSGKVRWQG